MAVTILELAYHRLGITRSPRVLNGADFESVGLQIMGGCERCGASIAAYNAHPSKTGFWRCGMCIGELGYDSVEAADAALEDEKGETEQTSGDAA